MQGRISGSSSSLLPKMLTVVPSEHSTAGGAKGSCAPHLLLHQCGVPKGVPRGFCAGGEHGRREGEEADLQRRSLLGPFR